jgi:hypothetical protein
VISYAWKTWFNITKQEKVSIYYWFKPVFGRICSREAKTKFRQCDWSGKKFAAKKLDQFFTLLLVASREQIRQVENVILLPVKYTVTAMIYYLGMTSLTSTNVFTISCLSIEPSPSLRSGKFSSTALVQSLAKSLLHYSSTIRTIRRLFAD